MVNLFCHTLLKIFKVLSLNSHLNYFANDRVMINISKNVSLFSCDNRGFCTPIKRINSIFDKQRSPLGNSFARITALNFLVKQLTAGNVLVRLNHIGICYKTASQLKEKKLLTQEAKKTDLNLYQEPSNDYGLWLFLGNTNNWEDPLLELLPVENTKDRWVNYWLPNFQIDLDTTLNCEQIEKLVFDTFQGKIKPFRAVVMDGVTYCVRIRLGIISGINIYLDLGTNSRNVKYVRKHILKKLG